MAKYVHGWGRDDIKGNQESNQTMESCPSKKVVLVLEEGVVQVCGGSFSLQESVSDGRLRQDKRETFGVKKLKMVNLDMAMEEWMTRCVVGCLRRAS